MTNGIWRERVEKTQSAVYQAVLDGHERQVTIIQASGLSGNTVHARLKDLEGEHLVRKTADGHFVPLVHEFMGNLARLGRLLEDEEEMKDLGPPDRQLAADLAPGFGQKRRNRVADEPDRRRMERLLRLIKEKTQLGEAVGGVLWTMHRFRLMVEGMTDAEFDHFEEDFP